MENKKDSLTKEDLKKWGKDVLVYCAIPVAIVFLQSLQTGDFHVAIGAAYAALLSSAISLLRKYSQGV